MTKSKKCKRYTQEEDTVLLKCVEEEGQVSKGCDKAATVLTDRTKDALHMRYYTVLKNCKNVTIINSTRRPYVRRVPYVAPNPVLVVIKKMLNLSRADQKRVVKFFK